TTRAPPAAATPAVPSVEPSSTTTTWSRGSDLRAARVRPRRAVSFRAGMTAATDPDPVRPPPRSFTEVSDPPTTSRNVRGVGRRGPGPPGLPRLDAPWVPRPPTRPAPAPRARGNGRRGSPSGTPRAGSPREGGGRPKRSPPL